jgi:Transposase DDE domain
MVAGGRGRPPRAGEKGGSATGPSPVDRARTGSKHHLLVEGGGIPLAWTLTGGNRHDSTQLIPLVDRVPPVHGKVGRPRRRPKRVSADRAYDSAIAVSSVDAASPGRSRDARPLTAPASAATGGSSSAPSPGSINSSDCSSVTTAVRRSTRPSSPSAAASSATADLGTPHCERSS